MAKNWENTTIEMIGTLLTDESGKIAFRKAEKYEKFTATLKIAGDNPWNRLARKSTFVFVDGLRQADVEAFKELESSGEIVGGTRIVITGHLVRTPGKPGMNDLFNLKTIGIRPAKNDESIDVNLDAALTKEEWQTIYKERAGRYATATAPVAPIAPTAPVAPF